MSKTKKSSHRPTSRNILSIRPRTDNQAIALDLLETYQVVIMEGLAGTGKTYLAVNHALKKLMRGEISKIIFTRPLTTVGNEKIGFLPGEVNDKVAPYLEQFTDYLEEFSPMITMDTAKTLEKAIEFIPLAFLRGRNFSNSVIIADEMQNSSHIQMKTLLTRIGEDTQLILLGDTTQEDVHQKEGNGLQDFIYKLNTGQPDNPFVGHIRFGIEDVQRSPFVKFVLGLYGE